MDQPELFDIDILSVSALNRYVRELMESDSVLRSVWVSGEISNYSKPSSGHIYFTLKDADSALKCVIWRTQAARMLLNLRNGMAIEAHGAISVYERDGGYQLYIDGVRLAGEGWLYREFLRLKNLLEEEGLFALERKRPVSEKPAHIGILTSPTGAALQDMLNTLRRRYPLTKVTLSPAQMQGDEAPASILRALARLIVAKPDVILVARGGGSIEDLWAFNDEHVVRAIANSPIPVITGIGHETDFTLSDFAADLRAPTPTAAAELATPSLESLRTEISSRVQVMDAYLDGLLAESRRTLEQHQRTLSYLSPWKQVQDNQQRLDQAQMSLARGLISRLRMDRSTLTGLARRLEGLNPSAILKRGYTLVRAENGTLVTGIKQINPAQTVKILWHDGSADAAISSTDRNIEGEA
ncbi:MAG TPA: exodeoxyribonuclease VII large subunit [Bellilinea sp.]|nr:exodeoxyribonuclease VII large subunit [Bellilinea sp.]